MSFGLIFLWETFNGLISVHNDSQDVAKDVPVKVELLTPSHRHLLLSEPPLPQLDPSACEERIISHEVKEPGEHSSEVPVFGKDNLLPPRNIRQHLYKLTPLSPLQTSGMVSNVQVGKMDIVWRSRFGERGRIQTG
ncbi:Trafficking protein particle complex subunit 13 [Geodia barretti]|uniref:Trafficking protein particle complex subunit 13 n=1 Tax=Geodia barretti TaxID=519541 RepID=A0AA35W726_GEOBA|nr:Trafficking protein particle complex subunit 13 [Geodia barretti]